MQHSPSWQANQFSASQEIPRVLRNPTVHYRIHKCQSPFSILSQPNPVHTPTSQYLKINPNIILPSKPGSHQRSLSLGFPHLNPIHASFPHPRYMPRPSHSSRFCHPHNIGWGVQIMELLKCGKPGSFWKQAKRGEPRPRNTSSCCLLVCDAV
jgi:hypothetical protein